MKTKNVKQIESNLPTKAQWLADNADKRGMDLGDGEFNLKKMLASVPENFIAIDSESTTGTFEDQAWEALRDFFPTNALFVTTYTKIAKAIRLEKQGIVAYVIGDMTWTVFIAPESLAILLKKSPATDGKSVGGQSVSSKENVMKTTKVVKTQKAAPAKGLEKTLKAVPSAQSTVDAALGKVARRINKAAKKTTAEAPKGNKLTLVIDNKTGEQKVVRTPVASEAKKAPSKTKVASKPAPKAKAPKAPKAPKAVKLDLFPEIERSSLGKGILAGISALVEDNRKALPQVSKSDLRKAVTLALTDGCIVEEMRKAVAHLVGERIAKAKKA